ncbi:MAG: hypothetical protein ACXWQR_01585 [Ktedonobacterales bacterium]
MRRETRPEPGTQFAGWDRARAQQVLARDLVQSMLPESLPFLPLIWNVRHVSMVAMLEYFALLVPMKEQRALPELLPKLLPFLPLIWECVDAVRSVQLSLLPFLPLFQFCTCAQ